MNSPTDATGRHGAFLRTILRLLVILVLAWGLHLLFNWARAQAEFDGGHLRFWMLAGFLLVYAVLIAVPFVPGIEVGLTLMAMEGPWIAPWIYAATVTGLTLAYLAGEFICYPRLLRVLADLRLHKACRLIERLQPMGKAERLVFLQERAPLWARPFVSQFRYVLLAVLINLPGNALIGGGGGLAFLAGFSRLFHFWPMLLTMVLAVAPVPAAVWLFDLDIHDLFVG